MFINMWRRLIAEALGSFLLTLSITASHFSMFQIPGTYYSAYPTAGSVVTIMMMTGFISGAKFNPAITIGHLVSQTLSVKVQKEDIIEHVLYIFVQMIAAIPGAYLGWGINRSTMYFDAVNESSTASAFFAELVYSTLIVGVALMLGKMNDSIIIGTIGLGAAYFGAILAVGLISGGCFNPALGLAANLVHYTAHQSNINRLWVYLIAPTLGGAIAGVLNTVFLSELKSQKRSRVDPSS